MVFEFKPKEWEKVISGRIHRAFQAEKEQIENSQVIVCLAEDEYDIEIRGGETVQNKCDFGQGLPAKHTENQNFLQSHLQAQQNLSFFHGEQVSFSKSLFQFTSYHFSSAAITRNPATKGFLLNSCSCFMDVPLEYLTSQIY